MNMNENCIEWGGTIDLLGYGRVSQRGKSKYAHRWAWATFNGPIPEGMCVIHSCDNRSCVNPFHLRVGTHGDNMDDMVSRGRHANQRKKSCVHGHPLIAGNLVNVKNPKIRRCLACSRIQYRRARERRRSA